jgi:UDP-glucose 4-epimerase
MQVVLTGASGNIGSSTLEALVLQGHHVRALVTETGKANVARAYRRHPQVEIVAGDVRDAAQMRRLVAGQDVVVHLAYVIPPASNTDPEQARAVNLDGTYHLLEAARRQPQPARFFFASTFDLFGNTADDPYPRHADDPVRVTDLYTAHKLQGEQWVRESGLAWSIFRFADVPLMGFRSPHPIMFDIPLSQRFEVLHTADAGLAVANLLRCDAAWNKMLLIGGGAACQITYGAFLFALLDAMGIGRLPLAAFTTQPYCSDWLDTAESQALLQYQRHSFADIVREIRALAGWRRQVIPLARPLVRRWLLGMSPYLRQTPASE